MAGLRNWNKFWTLKESGWMSLPQEHSLLKILLDQQKLLFELVPDERGDYNTLKQALVKSYSTKDRAWVKRCRLVARRQGPNELLSDYINDMHELFSGLNMAEVDKVTYFSEGLLQPLKTKVLERMPETLLQVEEVAGTVDSISQRETSTKESSQIERLIEAITRSQQVPAQATGTNASLNTPPQQSLQAQIETLTQKLNELKLTVTKSDKVAVIQSHKWVAQVRLKNLLNF